MIWVLTPGGFEDFVEEASVPAEAPTVPPASVVPPENMVEIVLRHGNELLPDYGDRAMPSESAPMTFGEPSS
jgi:hypothetical protein